MDRVNTYSSVKWAILHQPNTVNDTKPKDRLFQRINTVYYAALISPTIGPWLPYLHKPVQLHIMTSFLTNYIVGKLEHYKLCPFNTATTTNLLFYLNIMVTTSIRITSPGLIPAILAALAYSYLKQYNINTIISIEPIITGIWTLYFLPDLFGKCWSIYQIITCPFISALFQTHSQEDTVAAGKEMRVKQCVYQYFKHHGCTHPDKDFYIQSLAELFSTTYALIPDRDKPSEIAPFIKDGTQVEIDDPIPTVLRNLCIHVSTLTDCIDDNTLNINIYNLFNNMFEIVKDLAVIVLMIICECISIIIDTHDYSPDSYITKYEDSNKFQYTQHEGKIKLCNN
jgi:hypothetical protein